MSYLERELQGAVSCDSFLLPKVAKAYSGRGTVLLMSIMAAAAAVETCSTPRRVLPWTGAVSRSPPLSPWTWPCKDTNIRVATAPVQIPVFIHWDA